jgi:hypothetical protein
LHIKKSYKQFFWLFFSIGFFLWIFLSANEYLSHQLFVDELNAQTKICNESGRECNVTKLALADQELLHNNQKRIIELKEIVDDYGKSMITIFIIFIIFLLIGFLPIIWEMFLFIQSKINLLK